MSTPHHIHLFHFTAPTASLGCLLWVIFRILAVQRFLCCRIIDPTTCLTVGKVFLSSNAALFFSLNFSDRSQSVPFYFIDHSTHFQNASGLFRCCFVVRLQVRFSCHDSSMQIIFMQLNTKQNIIPISVVLTASLPPHPLNSNCLELLSNLDRKSVA